ncbi:DUF3054 domain-containing protein [Brachybacterium tyrofermentans]|uniref:DUF3054 domain-containing protein n=1 Tax=Brachybacterium tyrofermentans TaxID=47848 RepID=A0ABW0FIW0_9MICO|nr:DUF3054 domain-containing protein [Brachybacterium tyrofermentans]
MFRSLGALIGDLLVVILFVAIGFLQHGTPLTSQNLFLVGWPFAVGVLLGHLAIRAWRAPFRVWPHGVFVWAITIAAAMAIRTLFSAGTEVAFILTTAIFTGVLMLGWRAVAMYLTRGVRRVPLAGAGGEAGNESAATAGAEAGVGNGTAAATRAGVATTGNDDDNDGTDDTAAGPARR